MIMLPPPRHIALIGSLVLAALGCGSNPGQLSGAGALGGATIEAVTGPSKPLVVDWKPDQRADLEEVIHDGVAVVSWTGQGLRLVRTCSLPGNYGYLAVQMKRDVVRLASSEEIAANLPLGGLGIAGKLGGAMQHGATLDIALAIVGKRRTTWNAATKSDLQGQCDGATHFVRAVLVGAFAMTTGSQTKAAAAAEIFGIGAHGGTESSKDVNSADGSLEACEQSGNDDASPPNRCSAILRLELEPVTGEEVAAAPSTSAPKSVEASRGGGCPRGLVESGGSCKRPGAEVAYVCGETDARECAEQCKKGSAESCDRLGVLLVQGGENEAGTKAFAKACDEDFANGCRNLGFMMMKANGEVGLQALSKGCLLGSAEACEIIGDALVRIKEFAKAARTYVRGCEGGDFRACTSGAFLLSGGAGDAVRRNDELALAMSTRACFGGDTVACGNAGLKFEFGEGTAASMENANTLYTRACKLDRAQCFRLGMFLAGGAPGVNKNDAVAKQALEASCSAGKDDIGSLACVAGKLLYGTTGAANRQALLGVKSEMTPQCEVKEPRACTYIGLALVGVGAASEGKAALAAGCKLKDPLACKLQRAVR
jgi:TPR repeat protein